MFLKTNRLFFFILISMTLVSLESFTLKAQIAVPSIRTEADKIDISDFVGSRYLDEAYKQAVVYDGLTKKEKTVFVRYDAYKDVFEVKNSLSDTKSDFLKQTIEIHLKMDGKTFYYRNYTDDEGKLQWGYLHKIANVGEKDFYMKYGKKLIMPVEAKTTLEQDRPGKIKDNKYYIVGTSNQLAYRPVSKKTIMNYIPLDKRNDVKAFIKKEKLKFKDIKDIKVLADHYNKL